MSVVQSSDNIRLMVAKRIITEGGFEDIQSFIPVFDTSLLSYKGSFYL